MFRQSPAVTVSRAKAIASRSESFVRAWANLTKSGPPQDGPNARLAGRTERDEDLARDTRL